MEEKNISNEESLLIIEQMIQTAKKEQKDDGKGWIIWGWLLFLASVATFINLKIQWFNMPGIRAPWIIWVLTFPAKKKSEKSKNLYTGSF
jgi:hypothetical protein